MALGIDPQMREPPRDLLQLRPRGPVHRDQHEPIGVPGEIVDRRGCGEQPGRWDEGQGGREAGGKESAGLASRHAGYPSGIRPVLFR